MAAPTRLSVPLDKHAELYDAWTTGMNYRQLAERYDCGQATVGRVIKNEHRRRGHLRDEHFKRVHDQLRAQYRKADKLDRVGDAIRATIAETDLLGITGRAADIKVDVGVEIRSFADRMSQLAQEVDVYESGNKS